MSTWSWKRRLAELYRDLRTRILRNPWIPVKPTPKQLKFALLRDLEAFYGGAAFGGKSEGLLICAAMYVTEPEYNAIIFRKTIRSLQRAGGLIPRSKEWWLETRAHWSGDTLTWDFPNGATVGFGYLNHEDDYVQYGSTEYQLVGFDELPEIREEDYRFMFSRARRTQKQKKADIPIRVRSAGNPIGQGVPWVKRRFNLPYGTPEIPFIPARAEDNPYGDLEAYEESLNQLDPITRARLREGNWEIQDPGAIFNRAWFRLVRELPSGCKGVRYWDLAASEEGSWTAGALLASKGDGVFYIVDIKRMRGRPAQVEALVRQTAELDHDDPRLKSVDIWMEQEPGSSGVNTIDHYTRNILQGFTFRGNKVTGSKELRAAPVSSAAEAGNIMVLPFKGLNDWLDEAEAFPIGKYKDQVDAVSGSFEKLTRRKKRARYRSRVF